MNAAASKHLDLAKTYLAKGDEWYAKAADEIVAAKEADFSLTNQQIAERFGKHESTIRRIVAWRTSSAPAPTPDWERGSHATTAEIEAGTQRFLATAPMELVERLIDDLSPEQAAALATAALDRPGVVREIANDSDASAVFVRAEKEYLEESHDAHKRRTRKKSKGMADVAGVLAYVVGPVTKAGRLLKESLAAAREAGDLDDDVKEALEEEFTEIGTTLDWYRSYLASDGGSLDDELDKLLG